MRIRDVLLSGSVSVLASALLAPVAGAQVAQSGAAGPPATAEATSIGEVVVTAFKREQNLQDVPASISAVSGEALAARGIDGLQDLSKLVPNLRFGEHLGTTLITIRGVGSTVESGITEPTVAVYVDGVYLPRSTMATLKAVDIDRIEVLRGPQGTLYGRNATGGAVNFISAAPTRAVSAGADVGTGSRDAFNVSGFVSGPLAPGVFARLSGGHETQDGYTRVLNTGARLSGVDTDYVRGALRLEPGADLSLDLSARYEIDRAANAYQQLLGASPFAGPAGQTSQPNRIYADYPHSQKVETLVAAGIANWTISDNLALRSITSFVDHHSHAGLDADGTTTPFYFVDDFSRPSRSYGEELTLIGKYDRLSWIAGAFLYRERARIALPVVIGSAGAPAFGLPVGTTLGQTVASKTRSAALYGELTYAVTDRLRVNLGARYNHEEQDLRQSSNVSLGGVSFPGLPVSYGASPKADKILPKVALQYDLATDVNLYAQWSKGFKSGGLNLPGADASSLGPGLGPYQAETLSAFEVGLKSQWLDRRVTANLAGFYYKYSGLQVNTTLPPTTTIVVNADARDYGLEGEVRWAATPNLSLEASATLLHARFKDLASFDPFDGRVRNLDGRRVPNAPDLTFNLGGEYRFDLGGTWLNALTVRADVAHSDEVLLRFYGDPADGQKAYTLVNLSATLANRAKDMRLTAFVSNVGDVRYKQVILYVAPTYIGNYGPPRTWGVKLSKRY